MHYTGCARFAVMCSQQGYCSKKMYVYGFCIILHALKFWGKKEQQQQNVDSVTEQWHQYSIIDFLFISLMYFWSDALK